MKCLNSSRKTKKGHKLWLIFCAIILVAIMSFVSFQSQAQSDVQSPSPTRIEVNENSHVIGFYINGEPSAMLDEEGLHVIKNINYGGSIKDSGEDAIKDEMDKTIQE